MALSTEIQAQIDNHKLWLETDGREGAIANLSSANLSSADLSSADLRFADLSFADLSFADLRFANLRFANLRSAKRGKYEITKPPLQLIGLGAWFVCVFDRHIEIDCQSFSADKWKEMMTDDQALEDLDEDAIEWWDKYGPTVLAAATAHGCFEADEVEVQSAELEALQ